VLKLPWDIKKQGTPPKKVWGHNFGGHLDDRFHIVSREAADHHFAFERESRVCETPGVLSKCRLKKNNAIISECVWVDYNKLAGVGVDISYLKNIQTIRDGIERRDLDKFLQDNGLKNNT
jgi:ppGpp synthetase/RelA/SpoT-type nucleotidyltranferase